MDEHHSPTDRLFQDGIVFSSHLFDEVDQFSISWEDVDWEQESTVPIHVQDALVSAATQFQYGNMSHLILCGNIVRNEYDQTTLDHQKLAIVLAAYRIEGIELWGRYIKKMQGGETVSDELQRYYQHLFSEDKALSLLVGMEVLSGPLTYMMYDALRGQGDPVFNELVTNLAEQKEHELDLVTEFLSPLIRSSGRDTQNTLSTTVDQYTDIAEQILSTNSQTMKALDMAPVVMQDQILSAITDFRDELGIESY